MTASRHHGVPRGGGAARAGADAVDIGARVGSVTVISLLQLRTGPELDWAASALDTSSRQAGHDVPLENEEEDDGGNGRDGQGRDEHVLRAPVAEVIKADVDRVGRGLVQDEERPEEVFPDVDRGEDRDDADDRAGDRQDYPPH